MSQIRRKYHSAKPDSTLPLINIVLLLVLAFMIAGTFTEPLPANFEPVLAENGENLVPAAEPLILTLSADGTLCVDGAVIPMEGESIILGRAVTEASQVEIRADARTPAVRVIALLSAAEKEGLEKIEIVTLGRGK